MRFWLSGPRLFNGLVRPGISFGREDFRPRGLPSWRKFELCQALIKEAEARGEKMSKEEAAYCVEKALYLAARQQRQREIKFAAAFIACAVAIVLAIEIKVFYF
jgi:hypothetical protein